MPSPPRARGLSAGIGPDRTTVGIDLVFGAIAVDRGAGRLRDHGADASVDRALDQFIDQRVFECMERLAHRLCTSR